MNAIELNHVAKRYGDFALEDVNLTLPQGCVLGLIGENGAGKSTLIRMMLGACRPDGGEVRVLGEKAGRTATFTKVRQDIGVVLDEACLPDELTAQQVGKMMHGIYANWDDAAFSSLCARLDLPKGKKVKDFSRGTKMKLAIAVALSHKAKLLVLDEATGGLDPVVRDEILDLLNDFTRDEELVAKIRELVMENMFCHGMHDLIIHSYGPGNLIGSVHVEVDCHENIMEIHDAIDELERNIYDELQVHMTIHMDPIDYDDEKTNVCRDMMAGILKEIDEGLTMHDFRIVSGPTHTNLIFDVLVPYECKKTEAQIKSEIQQKLAEKQDTYYTVITFDKGYC